MAQIIPGTPGFGSAFGESLGAGLNALAQHKLSQVLERQTKKRDEEELGRAGLTPQYARFVAQQPKEHQYKYLIGAGPEAYKNQQQPLPPEKVQERRTLENQALAVTPQQQQSVGLQDLMQSLNPRAAGENQLNQLTGGQGGAGSNALQNLIQSRLGQQPGQQGQQGSPQANGLPPQQPIAPQQEQARPGTIYGSLPRGAASPKRNFEQENINTEGRKAVQKYEDKAKLAQTALDALGIQEELVNSGKMSNPKWAGFIKKNAGPEFTSVLSDESGKFDALNADLFPLLPYLIGGNVTDSKVKEYAKKLPQITDSPTVIKGKIKFIRDRVSRYIDEYRAASEVASEYDGQFPSDFNTRVKKRNDEIAKEKKENTMPSEQVPAGKTFEKLPSAASLPGKRVQFPDGTIRKSNGSQWVKE